MNGPELSPTSFTGRCFRPIRNQPSHRKETEANRCPTTPDDRRDTTSPPMGAYGISPRHIEFRPTASEFRLAGFPFSLQDTPHLAEPAGVRVGLTLP